MWCLQIQEKGKTLRYFTLEIDKEIHVGRSSSNDVQLLHPKISRQQLTLTAREDVVEICYNADASTIPQLNGSAMSPGDTVVQQAGAVIQLPDVELVLLQESDKAEQDHLTEGLSASKMFTSPYLENVRTSGSAPDVETPEFDPDSMHTPDEEIRLDEVKPIETNDFDIEDMDVEPPPFASPEAPSSSSSSPPTQPLHPPGNPLPAAETKFMFADPGQPNRTKFISEGDVAGIAIKHQKKSHPLLIFSIIIFGALFLLLLLLVNTDTSDTMEPHEGVYFDIERMPSWKPSIEEDVLFFSPVDDRSRGVLTLREQSGRIWSFDYASAAQEVLIKKLGDVINKSFDDSWQSPVTDVKNGQTGIVMQEGEHIPFWSFKMALDNEGSLAARIFLARDQCIVLAAWNQDGAIESKALKMMDTFRLKETEIVPDFVLRDVIWQHQDVEEESLRQILKVASLLFADRFASLNNAWRSQDAILNMYRDAELKKQIDENPELNEKLWKQHILPYAQYVEDEYRKRKSWILKAKASGDFKRVVQLSKEIKLLIPDTNDPRWLWAQKELSVSRTKASGGDGLF